MTTITKSSSPVQNGQPSATAASTSKGVASPVQPIVVESCHSTWIFDTPRMRFCRVLKGIQSAGRLVTTAWQPYWRLELDPYAEDFTVYLNPSRTRLIRSWRHTEDCRQCGSTNATSQVPFDLIESLLNIRGGECRLATEGRRTVSFPLPRLP
jgi:hypothetical protein